MEMLVLLLVCTPSILLILVFRIFNSKQTKQSDFSIVCLGVAAICSDKIIVNWLL